ncbi:MAG TPA: hypothetical protein VNW97_12510 [Candidatus Saccharimonadales bacterium]|jgi:hypothetical protein|nr:hypothetical protein [Candidatus Saccharimonadales bacterium]
MANIPLKNTSGSIFLKAIEEAADAISNWPNWKRDAVIFTKTADRQEVKEKRQIKEPPK